MAALLAVFKDTYTNSDIAMMRTSSGKVVMANMAKYPLPLYTAPVLPARSKCRGLVPRPNALAAWDQSAMGCRTLSASAASRWVGRLRPCGPRPHAGVARRSSTVEQLAVKADQGDAVAHRGHRIAATRWYSDTRVVFVTTTGDEIKVWDGKAEFRAHGIDASAEGQEVCAADVSCSAFLVDDVNRQEAVIEAANKALADKNLELSRRCEAALRRIGGSMQVAEAAAPRQCASSAGRCRGARRPQPRTTATSST